MNFFKTVISGIKSIFGIADSVISGTTRKKPKTVLTIVVLLASLFGANPAVIGALQTIGDAVIKVLPADQATTAPPASTAAKDD